MSAPRLTLLLPLAVAAACAGEDTLPDAAGLADAGVITDAGAPDAGPPDAGVAPAPPCPTRITWTLGPDFPEPRDHHATFVWTGPSGPSLYVVGGFNPSGVFTNAWRAAIAADGSLGEWTPAGRPDARTSGMALAQHGDRVYMLGGHSGAMRIAASSSFTVAATGELADPRAEPALPAPRFHASGAVHGDALFVTGGLGTSGEAEPSVFRARFGAAGALEAWARLDDLPAPRSHHSSYVQGDFLYLVGGFSGNPVGNRITSHPDVIRAAIDEGGGLGAWETVGPALPTDGVSTHANAVFEGCALTLGGITASPATCTTPPCTAGSCTS